MGDGLRRAEPARCVEVEALRDARCSRPELRREGGKDLELRGAHDRAETELRGRARQPRQEQPLRLVGREAGQPGPVAIHEADTAARSAFGVDRNAGLAQGIDVTVDGPDRDLELFGQLGGGQASARLQQEQQVNQATRAHAHAAYAIS